MDIYGDDIDNISNTNPLNANIEDDDNDENTERREHDEDGAGGGGGSDDENGPKTVVEPKRRTVRRPQLSLNVERLKTERGLHTLENYYKDIKFNGKGHESADLDNIMKRMEHWAHRLYPKYNFDDFLDTTEKLGKKKELQTHMNRYRQGMLEPVIHMEDKSDGEEDVNATVVPEPIDEFDDLIGQQIEKYRTAPHRTPAHESIFNTLRNSTSTTSTPSFNRNPMGASTPRSPDALRLPATPVAASTTLSTEQMARIAENRRLAQERLRAKRDAAAQQKDLHNTEESELTGISILSQ